MDGDSLTAVLGIGPSHGSLTLNSDGSFSYTPEADFNGTDSFSYVANDGTADSESATVTITVNPVNDAPVANDDAVTTDEDTTVTITLTGSDIEGDALSYQVISGPANGTLAGTAPELSYTPNADYNGPDAFTFTANDGALNSIPATVTITVNSVNDAPVANDDTITTNEDTPATYDVLSNDSDVDGDTLSVHSVTDPANGTAVVNTDNTVTYRPNENYNGNDSFIYTVSDGQGGTDTATVTITVNPVNDAPVANDDSATTDEDSPLSADAPGVLGNDTDVDGDSLTALLGIGPSHGTLTLNSDGSFSYTPEADFNGTDSFTYTTSDGNGGEDTATLTITIAPVNDAPVANDDIITTNEDTPATYNVLSNDSDVEGDALAVSSVTNGASGTVVINPDNSVTYTPNENYNGNDSFTYTVSDGQGGIDTATVNVTVTPVNDAPVANDDTVTTNEDTPATYNVLSNDSDVEGDALAVSSVTNGARRYCLDQS